MLELASKTGVLTFSMSLVAGWKGASYVWTEPVGPFQGIVKSRFTFVIPGHTMNHSVAGWESCSVKGRFTMKSERNKGILILW